MKVISDDTKERDSFVLSTRIEAWNILFPYYFFSRLKVNIVSMVLVRWLTSLVIFNQGLYSYT